MQQNPFATASPAVPDLDPQGNSSLADPSISGGAPPEAVSTASIPSKPAAQPAKLVEASGDPNPTPTSAQQDAGRGGSARRTSQQLLRPMSPRIRQRAAAFQQQAAMVNAEAVEQPGPATTSAMPLPVMSSGRTGKTDMSWERFDNPMEPFLASFQQPGGVLAGGVSPQTAAIVPSLRVQAGGGMADVRGPARIVPASSRPGGASPRASLRISPRMLGEGAPQVAPRGGSPTSQAVSPKSPSGRPITRRESQV